MVEGSRKGLPDPEEEPLKIEVRIRMGEGVQLDPQAQILFREGNAWTPGELQRLIDLQKRTEAMPTDPLDVPDQGDTHLGPITPTPDLPK